MKFFSQFLTWRDWYKHLIPNLEYANLPPPKIHTNMLTMILSIRNICFSLLWVFLNSFISHRVKSTVQSISHAGLWMKLNGLHWTLFRNICPFYKFYLYTLNNKGEDKSWNEILTESRRLTMTKCLTILVESLSFLKMKCISTCLATCALLSQVQTTEASYWIF